MVTREDSVARSRMRLFDIVEGNFSFFPNPIFCTFTFAEKKLDLVSANSEFRNFLRRFSRRCFGEEGVLEYLAVAERQELRGEREGNEGEVHYHAVFFNLPKFFYEKERERRIIANCWSHGFVDCRLARKTLRGGSVRNLPAYLAKYLGKSSCVISGRSFFFASRGLARPSKDSSMEVLTPPVNSCMMEREVITYKRGSLTREKFVYDSKNESSRRAGEGVRHDR